MNDAHDTSFAALLPDDDRLGDAIAELAEPACYMRRWRSRRVPPNGSTL